MKRSDSFILRQVAGKQVLVPVGSAAVEFPGMVDLNNAGSYVWQLLETEQTQAQLLQALLDKYEAEEATVKADLEKFLQRLKSINAILA